MPLINLGLCEILTNNHPQLTMNSHIPTPTRTTTYRDADSKITHRSFFARFEAIYRSKTTSIAHATMIILATLIGIFFNQTSARAQWALYSKTDQYYYSVPATNTPPTKMSGIFESSDFPGTPYNVATTIDSAIFDDTGKIGSVLADNYNDPTPCAPGHNLGKISATIVPQVDISTDGTKLKVPYEIYDECGVLMGWDVTITWVAWVGGGTQPIPEHGVIITKPKEGTNQIYGETIKLEILTVSTDGCHGKDVSLYTNNVYIGTATFVAQHGPICVFTFDWNGALPGANLVTAHATFSDGATAETTPLLVQVIAPVIFTGGSISSPLDFLSYPGYTFTFDVTGTPFTVWDVYSYDGPATKVGTIEIGWDGKGSFTDMNPQTYDWNHAFYQLRGYGWQSPIFGCKLVSVGTSFNCSWETAFEVENPLVPPSPGTLNSVLKPSVVWDADGNLLPSGDYGDDRANAYGDGANWVDVTEDPYDHVWFGDSGGWIVDYSDITVPAWSGDEIPFGHSDTIWLGGGFSGCTIGFVGYLPQQ